MALILCIETSQPSASLALSRDGHIISFRVSAIQKEHASFLQPAIKEMMQEAGMSLTELDAVSVCEGPGSYTGLRVGMASAKGICYALRKPLIAISSLSVMGYVARQDIKKTAGNDDYWIVPMIDARRNEVFTAVLDQHLNIMMPPQAMILQPNSFAELEGKSVFFTGNGSPKWQSLCSLSQAVFLPLEWDAAGMVPLSELNYSHAQFASVESAVPLYGKSFYTVQAQQSS
jgi:tRNA threonylcarbamoyladenosine biosynthesis protein TsaB